MDRGRRHCGAATDCARNRRPGHPRSARHLPSRWLLQTDRVTGASASSTPSTSTRTTFPFCLPGGDRGYAALSRHRRRPLGGKSDRARTSENHLRVPLTHRRWRTRRIRQRLVRSPAHPTRRHLRRGDPAHAGRRAPEGWVPEQKITVEEALRAYTYEAAYASFEEDIKGTLKPGMLADFVLIDRDLTAIPPRRDPRRQDPPHHCRRQDRVHRRLNDHASTRTTKKRRARTGTVRCRLIPAVTSICYFLAFSASLFKKASCSF